MKIAVIGAGRWGRNLVRNFNELGVLGMVVDRSQEALTSVACAAGISNDITLSTGDGFDMLTHIWGLDAVAIATPAETHYELAKMALLRDLDVFVEKPMCLDRDQADELVQLAQEHERILMVGHLLRYHPAFEVLLQKIWDGELGKINYVYSTRLNLGRVRTIENALWSFAPHDVSAILAQV